MANMSSRFYINKQQVAFIIHPKQTNGYPNINKKCRGIARIRNQTINLLHSYLRVPFSSKVLFLQTPQNLCQKAMKNLHLQLALSAKRSLIKSLSETQQEPPLPSLVILLFHLKTSSSSAKQFPPSPHPPCFYLLPQAIPTSLCITQQVCHLYPPPWWAMLLATCPCSFFLAEKGSPSFQNNERKATLPGGPQRGLQFHIFSRILLGICLIDSVITLFLKRFISL